MMENSPLYLHKSQSETQKYVKPAIISDNIPTVHIIFTGTNKHFAYVTERKHHIKQRLYGNFQDKMLN